LRRRRRRWRKGVDDTEVARANEILMKTI